MWATEGHPEHEGITGVTFEQEFTRFHAFAWHRRPLRVLIWSWLDEATRDETDQGA